MSERDASVVLTDDESRDVLTQVIVPAWTKDAVPQDRPVVVMVGGQPGAGKTQIADLIQAVLDRRGGAVRIGRDLYKAAHRHYTRLLAADVRTAGAKVRPDTRRWQAAVEEHVRAHRFDAVVETALADPDDFRTAAASYRRSGTRIELVALSTAEAWSQLGLLSRFLAETRYVSWENHDGCAKGMLRTLAVIEAEQLADRITVVRRDGTVLYTNELIDGAWRRRPAAHTAVAAGRVHPWSARETAVFRKELAQADQRLHREALPEDQRLAVQRDAERAAALAEPVRRIAQATAEPPGVDYHRLSAEEHRFIFDELIVPSYLDDITPHDQPVVVYVMAQPGAGKTRAARLVQRALRGRRPSRIVGEDFKASHPDYRQLLLRSPRGAGAAIRADYRAWQTQAEAYVRARRGDAVIEISPGSVEQFLESATLFQQANYRIELVALAVREADSRQGTAARYTQALRLGLPARFTTSAGHGRCFNVVPDAVRTAEERAIADLVTVIRRDHDAVYRNERGSDGRLIRPAHAAWALKAEQHRPYTAQEAMQFLALQRRLRMELPQHRDELGEITALARPLIPAHLRPRRLPRAVACAALPVQATATDYRSSVSSFSRVA